ncbi:hypothetical protein GCM10009528_31710 [Kineococcus aurantiacus]
MRQDEAHVLRAEGAERRVQASSPRGGVGRLGHVVSRRRWVDLGPGPDILGAPSPRSATPGPEVTRRAPPAGAGAPGRVRPGRLKVAVPRAEGGRSQEG